MKSKSKQAATQRNAKKNSASKKAKSPSASNPTAIGQALRALGGIGGGALGGYFGNAALGSSAGSGLGAMVSKWLGQGKYEVSTNSLVNRFKSSGDIPSMHRSGQSVVVRHKEYLGDVTSSTGFAISNTIPLNPGLDSSFPWLSGIAQQYQEYTWKGLIFEFVSTSGDVVASSNTALGTVAFATQYRATAAPYYSKEQMLNEYLSNDAKPSECFCHPVECDPKENPYQVQYVRSGAVPAGEDQKTYDLGVTYIATQGMQAASIDVGEIWVSYEIELRKPVPSSLLDVGEQFATYANSTTVAAATPFGTPSGLTKYNDNIGLSIISTAVAWPAGTASGTYFLLYVGSGPVTAASLSTFVSGGTLVNCTASAIGSAGSLAVNTNYTVGTTNCAVGTYITITNPTLTATFTPQITTMTGASSMILRVFQVPYQSTPYY